MFELLFSGAQLLRLGLKLSLELTRLLLTPLEVRHALPQVGVDFGKLPECRIEIVR